MEIISSGLMILLESYPDYDEDLLEGLLKFDITRDICQALQEENVSRLTVWHFRRISTDPDFLLDASILIHTYGHAHGKEDFLNLALMIAKTTRPLLQKGTERYTGCLFCEANSTQSLGYLGIKMEENLNQSIKLFQMALNNLTQDPERHLQILVNMGSSYLQLAECGINPQTNLQEALKLYKKASEGHNPESDLVAITLLHEALTRRALAEYNVDEQENISRSIDLCDQAINNGLIPYTEPYGFALLNKGRSIYYLTRLVVDIRDEETFRKKFDEAINACKEARQKGLIPGTVQYGRSLITEAEIIMDYIEIDESDSLLDDAAGLCQRAREECFTPYTYSFANALLTEARVMHLMANRSDDEAFYLQEALDLYKEAEETYFHNSINPYIYFEKYLINHRFGNYDEAYQDIRKSIECIEKERSTMQIIEHRQSFIEHINHVYGKAVFFCLFFRDKIEEAFELSERARGRIFLEMLGNEHKCIKTTPELANKLAQLYMERDEIEARTYKLNKNMEFIPTLMPLQDNDAADRPRSSESLYLYCHSHQQDELSRVLKQIDDTLKLIRLTDPEYYSTQTMNPIQISELQKILGNRTLIEYFFGEKSLIVFLVNSNQIDVRMISDEAIPEIVGGGKNGLPFESMSLLVKDYLDENTKLFKGYIHEIEKLTIEIEDGFTDSAARERLVKQKNKLQKETEELLSYFYRVLIKPIKSKVDEMTPESRSKGDLYREVVIVPHGILHYLPWQMFRDNDGKFLVESWAMSFAQSASSLRYIKEKGNGQHEPLIIGGGFDGYDEKEDVAKMLGVSAIPWQQSTRKRFMAELESIPNRSIVHVSAHGEYDRNDPKMSRLILNRSVITAIDFVNMSFDLHEFVLSSCESGVSELGTGDELNGFIRSIQIGGARIVVASLWRVHVNSTRELFRKYYESVKGQNSTINHGDPAVRMRNAIIHLMNEKRYTFWHYGAFQVYGF